MAEVIVTEEQDSGAAEVAGAAAMASGAALAQSADAGAQAGDAQAQAQAAQQEAAAARAEAEAARIAALDAREATAELARLQLTQHYANQQREPVVEAAPVVVAEAPPEGDEPPKSVAKKVQKKTMRERWGG